MTHKPFLTLIFASLFSLAVLLPIPAHATAPIATTQYVSTDSCTNLTVSLWYGAHDATTGGQVTMLQNFLHANNYLSVTATGYFGPMTRAGVKAYQGEHGLAADGIVGMNTRAHILAANGGCYQLPPVSFVPAINAITPSAAASGTTVTISGSGFTQSNIVHLSIGGISNIPSGNGGTTLTFAVPSYIGPYCKPGNACPLYVQLLNAGTYPVSVENANGTSNAVQLTITNNATQIPN